MVAQTFDTIFTLDARSNIFLEVMTSHLKLSDAQVFREIRDNFSQLKKVLGTKGVPYGELSRALVPSTDKNERAFVFDWTMFDTANYGREVAHRLLPLLDGCF